MRGQISRSKQKKMEKTEIQREIETRQVVETENSKQTLQKQKIQVLLIPKQQQTAAEKQKI